MKTLIISLLTVMFVLPAFAQQPPPPPPPPEEMAPPPVPDTPEAPLPPDIHPGKDAKKEDTTIVEIGKLRIVIREKEGSTINVKVENQETGEVLHDKDPGQKTTAPKPPKPPKNVKTRYGILEFGVNGYHAPATGFDAPDGYPEFALQYGKSVNINLHLFQQRLNLVKHHLNIKYGLMLGFHDYRLADRQQTILPRQPMLTFSEIDEQTKKSKLSATYLNLPLMLNFESNPGKAKRSLHLNAGGYAGVLLGARTKYKTVFNDKVKTRDDFGLSQIQYGLAAQVGYGRFNLYANYGLSEMFATGKGPSVNPFSVGIILIPF